MLSNNSFLKSFMFTHRERAKGLGLAKVLRFSIPSAFQENKQIKKIPIILKESFFSLIKKFVVKIRKPLAGEEIYAA